MRRYHTVIDELARDGWLWLGAAGWALFWAAMAVGVVVGAVLAGWIIWQLVRV